jgi:hypothetical protein
MKGGYMLLHEVQILFEHFRRIRIGSLIRMKAVRIVQVLRIHCKHLGSGFAVQVEFDD